MKGASVAVLGATGLVGQEVLKVLEERAFPVSSLKLVGSERSAGQTVRALGDAVKIETLDAAVMEGVDVVFSAVSADVARQAAPLARRAGAVMIDKSSAFRMDPEVPLVVPEVNPEALSSHPGIVASPNCSTIQLVAALQPIRQAFGLARVDVATYQAVSGTGREAIEELDAEVASPDHPPAVYPKPIAFNVLAQVDAFFDNGYSVEEMKLIRESRRILGDPDLALTATAVRVPVRRGHAEAVSVETERPFTMEDVLAVLRRAPGVRLVELPEVPSPLDADGNDLVWVGRVRQDLSRERGFHMFVVSDNLRKGAATNAVQIAEHLVGTPS